MTTDTQLGDLLHSFFSDYLVSQRNVSRHTVLSYRDSLKYWLTFASRHLNKPVTTLVLEDLGVDLTLAFLDNLERTRANTVATRNVRLAALHAFFRYMAAHDPTHLGLCQRVIGIPLKRAPMPSTEYLERDEIAALFKQIPRSTARGRRDHALLCFAYQTGARVQEIITVRACDLQLDPPTHVRIWGKARKERVLPLWEQMTAVLRALLDERHVDPRSTTTVFVNMRGRPLSRWGVRYILAKYVRAAAASGSSVGRKRIHPHTVRHTTACHMLQAGVDPNAIRDVLGHSSSATTWRYARINMEMKRVAMESCTPEAARPRSPVPIWHQEQGLIEQLEAIGRHNAYVATSPDSVDKMGPPQKDSP